MIRAFWPGATFTLAEFWTYRNNVKQRLNIIGWRWQREIPRQTLATRRKRDWLAHIRSRARHGKRDCIG
jgi:hypothetical protein